MRDKFEAIADQHKLCKCCGASTSLFGVVDFHKNCSTVTAPVLGLSGIPIYYYRCPACKFLFTAAFDGFTEEDFRDHIYNQDYHLVDPDAREIRPRGNASFLCNLFKGAKPKRILDYGGGDGLLAQILNSTGMGPVDTYDPMVPRHATRPSRRFDCILSFEVLEHATNPGRTIWDMNDLLTPAGLILFSTVLLPADIDKQGLNWWYAGPRNGHVSLFAHDSLLKLIKPYGFALASFGEGLHALFRNVPDFAKPFLLG